MSVMKRVCYFTLLFQSEPVLLCFTANNFFASDAVVHCLCTVKKVVRISDVDNGGTNQTTWGSENSYSHVLWFCVTNVNIQFCAFWHGFFKVCPVHTAFKYFNFKVFHGHMGMATWTWPHGHGRMDKAAWTWPHGHGRMDMNTWTWTHEHGHMNMDTWTWTHEHGHGQAQGLDHGHGHLKMAGHIDMDMDTDT